MATDFSGPDADTTSAPDKAEGARPEWYELVSQHISEQMERFASVGPIFLQSLMENIACSFHFFMAILPTEVAHELARRYVHVPERFRSSTLARTNHQLVLKLAGQIQSVLTDLANRKDE